MLFFFVYGSLLLDFDCGALHVDFVVAVLPPYFVWGALGRDFVRVALPVNFVYGALLLNFR